jgi:competence protein CoiA
LERALETVRPDVSAEINGVPVAIEVQISSLSVETIMRRTIDYAQRGIYVLWLLQWTPDLDARRYNPKLWEKWIHAAYFGRVYYWVEGLTVVSYHFDPNFKSFPKKSWYSKDGEKMTAGGYSRKSKRYRTAVREETFNLATDFAPKQRYWWEGNGLKVPDAKLFMQRASQSGPKANYGFRRWE